MVKWAQNVINWKKMNVNKVSETFETCRQLCMLTLEGVERLTIDLFIIQNDNIVEYLVLLHNNSTTKSLGLRIARLYIDYIHKMKSEDDRRIYMFGFVIMTTQFRNYWKATRLGDRVTIEHIQNK